MESKSFISKFVLIAVVFLSLGMNFINPQGKKLKFKLSPGKKIEAKAYYDQINDFQIKMVNTSDSALNLSWKLISNSLVNGWDYSMCNYGQCLLTIPDSGKMKPIKKRENGFLAIHINPYQISGKGIVKFYVYETNNQQNGETITFVIKGVKGKANSKKK